MIYEYRCVVCGNVHEERRKVADRDEPTDCPTCAGVAERIQSLPAKRTDGIYSYAPNIGNPDKVERFVYGGDE